MQPLDHGVYIPHLGYIGVWPCSAIFVAGLVFIAVFMPKARKLRSAVDTPGDVRRFKRVATGATVGLVLTGIGAKLLMAIYLTYQR
jgi:hypothetical protein